MRKAEKEHHSADDDDDDVRVGDEHKPTLPLSSCKLQEIII